MAKRGAPIYQRTADEMLSMISSGKLGTEFTVPEAAKLAGVKEWAARKAAEHLAERGLIEPHQGSGYRALVTREQAAASRIDDRSLRIQVTELQEQVAGLRRDVPPGLSETLERIETSLEDLRDKLGYDTAPDSTSERGKESTPAARHGRTG